MCFLFAFASEIAAVPKTQKDEKWKNEQISAAIIQTVIEKDHSHCTETQGL